MSYPKKLKSKTKELLAKSIGVDHLKAKGDVVDLTCGTCAKDSLIDRILGCQSGFI